MSTLVGFASDTHGPHKRPALELFVRESGIEHLVLAGDVQDYRPYPVPTSFWPGNHESWPVIAEMRAGTRKVPNLRCMRDSEVLRFDGVPVTGIGGCWSPNPASVHPKRLDHDHLVALPRTHADVVVSHETPIRFSNRNGLTLAPLREACERMRPKLWVSGHHHYWDVEKLGSTTIVSLGMWPDKWIVVEFDAGYVKGWHRFAAADKDAYEAEMWGWREAADEEKDRLLALEKSGGDAVYGV